MNTILSRPLVGQWGYQVETAASAEDALALVEAWHPAVVITDLVLPEMDGVALLRRLGVAKRVLDSKRSKYGLV